MTTFLSIDELSAAIRDLRVLQEKHEKQRNIVNTVFPKGYTPVEDFGIMVEIARDNQLNPLYASVIEEFDDATARLHAATRKLIQAVKLTDIEEIENRKSQDDGIVASSYTTANILNSIRNQQIMGNYPNMAQSLSSYSAPVSTGRQISPSPASAKTGGSTSTILSKTKKLFRK